MTVLNFAFTEIKDAEKMQAYAEYVALIPLRDQVGVITFNFYEE